MLQGRLLVLCFLLRVASCSGQPNATKLYLLGLFPWTGAWDGAEATVPATMLAVQDINADPKLLPDYELVVITRDTECDGGTATDEMYKELYNTSTTKIMILGPACSIATEPTAQASHHWNLVQISYSATSPKLSTRSLFPRFFRLLPPDSMLNVVKIAMFKEFHWTKVATIQESAPLFSLTTADFHIEAKQAGIEVIAAETFIDNPTTQIENIQKSGARIIVAGFYGNMARRVFCAAYHQKMYGAKYVWIVPGWLEWHWWRKTDASIDCSVEQMDEAVAYHFAVNIDNLPSDANRAPSLSGMTSRKFLERFAAVVDTDDPSSLTGFMEKSFAYDTVWTVALALHEAERQLSQLDPPRTVADFAYDSITCQILFDVISSLSFEGISGPIKFNSNGDRLGLILLRQLQDGSDVKVGTLDPTTGTGRDITWLGYEPISWLGGAPPIDFIIEREDRQTIQLSLFLTGAILATVGIALACCFLAFNIHFKKLRVIKMSSPNINNLMLIGGMLAYVAIIFLGVDTNIASTDTFVWMCRAKTWCLSIGFSLAFGSMFSKTWRVHKIFTNKTAAKMVLKDSRLFCFVTTLVLLDVLILVLWETLDPLVATERFGTKVIDDENDDIVYTPIRMMCESRNQTYWIGAFYVIDGLLLIFGAFLAWETRKVSIPALNDSKYIGVCVYNVLILSFVGAPVSFILEERNAHYALVATLIWLATTLTLCVVFVPKIRTRNDVQPAQNTLVSQVTQSHQGVTSVDAQKELQLLRQEIGRLRKNLHDLGQDDKE
ncbi:gamma-aminobutyric acid type B receptor subunit 1-like [Patiria miniata]|uniref:Gamma-aminobutyric acid type B receptor subunit 2 n=1 Tax=Patiria miniata TaxID=46514 RepID=A0A913ZJ42_PATMI|nr:gamma-aminobutyric acid type B receptor subunit 1-like [Patiria miniata]